MLKPPGGTAKRAPKDVSALRAISEKALSEHCDKIREGREVPFLLYLVVTGKATLNQIADIPIEKSRDLDQAFRDLLRSQRQESYAALMDNDTARSQLRERAVRRRLKAGYSQMV